MDSSFVEILKRKAYSDPDKICYTFLVDGEAEEIHISFGELDRQARSISSLLLNAKAKGERVLLLYPAGLEYIAAFFGCLYAGAIAVPVYPPRKNRSVERIEAIIEDSEAKYALTNSHILEDINHRGNQALSTIDWIVTDDLNNIKVCEEPVILPTDLAFLQYTSGSTGKPKGVMVNHGNLVHNAEMAKQAFNHSDETIFVGWLPLYHDMGLIGNVLQPMYLGVRCVFMTPVSFLQKPVRWLQAISRYKGTTSGAPNFAYELCATKVTPEQVDTLDLSSWKVAFNGAEPVRAETIEKFSSVFRKSGFKKEAFYPCYGMAEATLLISGGYQPDFPLVLKFDPGELEKNKAVISDKADSREIVSCGYPWLQQEIAIVNPETFDELPEGEVGEIWLKGPSVARGYWRNKEETERIFNAQTKNTKRGPFLRTGDLGFIKKGEIFIAGRLKDLIIIRGRNHYPNDIELTVEKCHHSLRPGSGAAFSIEKDGEEQLVIIQEIEMKDLKNPDIEGMVNAIRQSVSENHELQAHTVVILKPGSIPKTTSGKIQRLASKKYFLSNNLSVIGQSSVNEEEPASSNDNSFLRDALSNMPKEQQVQLMEAYLKHLVSRLLKLKLNPINVQQPLTYLGLDSLMAIEIHNHLMTDYKIDISMSRLLEGVSIKQIAEECCSVKDKDTLSFKPKITQSNALSYNQSSLYYIHKSAPENSAYNISTGFILGGNTNIEILKESFNELVERHEILRTNYVTENGKPLVRIHNSIKNFIIETDATSWTKDSLNSYISKSVNTPFDIEKAPIIRIDLLKLSAQELVVLISVHHIAMDLWSLLICIDEVRTIYDKKVKNEKPELSLSPASYLDFSQLQLDFVESEKGKNSFEYWKKQLSGELPVLDMPLSKPRPVIQTYNGSLFHFDLNNKTKAALRQIAKNTDTTLFVTLLTSFHVLLYRYTGQNDIVVGTPTSGRNKPGFSGLVGNLVNPVAIRSYPSSELSFLQFQNQVKETVLKAIEHQAYPFQLLVEKLQSKRQVNRSPVFQAMFVFQQAQRMENAAAYIMKTEGGKMNFGNLSMESIAIEQNASQFDLSFITAEDDNGLSVCVEYNTDLFERSFISGLCKHFEILIQGIIENGDKSISAVPIISVEEGKQILEQRNNTRKKYPTDKLIHELFEKKAVETPEQIALVYDDRKLSYKELNEKANQLANHLRKHGVGPNQVVGICAERSLEMVIGLYGIMKAGGAYLPLDPSYPKERLNFLCKDANLKIILTHDNVKTNFIGQTDLILFNLDKDWNTISDESTVDLNVDIRGENTAYVIYTSGSTGAPKGVMVPHAGLLNRLQWMQEEYKLTSTDRVLQKTPYSFDVSVWEFFWPLIAGASLVVAKPGGHMDPSYLKGIISKENITTIHFVPSMLSLFLDEDKKDKCKSLKRVICSGEALTLELQEKFFNSLNAELHNLYGPTEASIDVSYWKCIKDIKLKTVPIGRPISNIQLYILNDMMQPVPDGCSGELYIGGVGLAKGYLNRPDLTEQKFIPNPFLEGTRLYKTGDLVRFLPDGNIEFFGRIDHQVKIRGFRIELGEIEERLKQHPLVNDAIVVAKNYTDNTKRLVAYVVNGKKQAPNISDLRSFLKETLPEYMVPASFMVLAEIPLSSNGKIDRKNLPEPKEERSVLKNDFVSPRDLKEEVLADIWSQVLEVEKVGINDNFYELGGDSLRSLQIKAKAKERGLDFSIQQLLHNQTVSELAKAIDNSSATHQPVREPMKPFQLLTEEERAKIPEGIEDAFPLSSLQTGLMFISELQPLSAFYHDIFVYEMECTFNFECFKAAIQLVSKRHPILRTSVSMQGFERPLQFVHKDVEVEVKQADIRNLDPKEQEEWTKQWIENEKKNYFDWNVAPFIRFNLHRLSDKKFNYVLSFHDSILDGWSGANMNVDIFTHYFALLEKRDIVVEPAPLISYRDFVLQEQSIMNSEQSKNYWTKRLKDAPFTQAPRLPAEAKTDGIPRSQDLHFEIPSELFHRVLKFSKEVAFPLKSILLAAHFRMMSLVTGEMDLLSGLMCNGRLEETDGDRSLGMHLNAVPFRVKLKGGSWIDLIKQIFEAEREMLPYRTFPMHMLQNKGGQPLFEFNFNFTHFHVYEKYPYFNDMYQKGYFIDPFHYPLTANFRRIPFRNQLLVALNYNDSALNSEQIECIAGYYIKILDSMVTNPDVDYTKENLLSESENRKIIIDWNNTEKNYAEKDLCLHQLFERQVEKSPNAIALLYGGRELTYGELNEKVNKLARYLRKKKVKKNAVVGIYAERSLEMVIGLLGIMKSGGAYLPLDPSYPRERIASIIADADMDLILSQEHLLGDLDKFKDQEIINLDQDWNFINEENGKNPEFRINNNDLAYVIYTSGSTGIPNGVMIQHHGITNRILWMQDQYRLTHSDSVLQKTPFSFDVSVWEFFWPLISGAKLVIAKPEGHKDPYYLTKVIIDQNITTLHFVPSMLSAFLESEEVNKCISLKRVFCSGEALSHNLQQKFYKQLKANLFNLYGPTEASVDVTHWPCNAESKLDLVPIGYPIANTRIYILDAKFNPVPVGVRGMLYIGGVNLALGYLNRPKLTKQKFINHPVSKERLYKTGDVARYLADGSIEFLGREDHQVKVRGFRIELGEIENALVKSGLVKDASVIVREDIAGDKRLAAYLVPRNGYQSKEIESIKEKVSFEQIALWREVFENAYDESSAIDKTFNTAGYNSSYTGQPFENGEVKQHINFIVTEIKSAKHEKILDLGCGTGILMFPLLKTCKEYVGVDFSEKALMLVKEGLATVNNDFSDKVRLYNSEATDFKPAKNKHFDVVLINSLLQYCTSENHLLKMLKFAFSAVSDNGRIVICNVRDLTLLRSFHTSVEFGKAPDALSINDFISNVKSQIELEDEMFIHPEFFNKLPVMFPEIGNIKIQLKRGAIDNEFTKFCYDVILTKGQGPLIGRPENEIAWGTKLESLLSIEKTLKSKKPDYLYVSGIPNSRLFAERFTNEVTGTVGVVKTVGEVRSLLEEQNDHGISPEAIWKTGDDQDYDTQITVSGDSKWTFDAMFRKKDLKVSSVKMKSVGNARKLSKDDIDWTEYINIPTRRRFEQELILKCQEGIKQALPEYMAPSYYIVMESMPLTSSGKTDKKSLPEPIELTISSNVKYVAPRNETEERIASVWSGILAIPISKIGIDDNFFDLGGNSLSIIRMRKALNQALSVNVSIPILFEYPNIRLLMEYFNSDIDKMVLLKKDVRMENEIRI